MRFLSILGVVFLTIHSDLKENSKPPTVNKTYTSLGFRASVMRCRSAARGLCKLGTISGGFSFGTCEQCGFAKIAVLLGYSTLS